LITSFAITGIPAGREIPGSRTITARMTQLLPRPGRVRRDSTGRGRRSSAPGRAATAATGPRRRAWSIGGNPFNGGFDKHRRCSPCQPSRAVTCAYSQAAWRVASACHEPGLRQLTCPDASAVDRDPGVPPAVRPGPASTAACAIYGRPISLRSSRATWPGSASSARWWLIRCLTCQPSSRALAASPSYASLSWR
jgi:hypothetical protein